MPSSGDSDLKPLVGIVDDLINEADQQFVCVVRVLDTSLVTSGRVRITKRATVITIVDNDRKSCHIWVDDTYPFMVMCI